MNKISKTKYAIGVDIGGSHISSAIVDISGRTILNDVITTTAMDSCGSASEVLDVWASNIKETVSHSNSKEINRIGFAFPGPFDYRNGTSLIRGIRKFESIYGLNITGSLYARLVDIGANDLRYVNDASAFALGECFAGAGHGCCRVLVLTLGTGLGSGFVAENKLVDSGESVPKNGWVYCLPFESGIADDAFTTRWIVDRYRELSGKMVRGAKEVADNAATGEHEALLLFTEYGRRLAGFAAPIIGRFGGDTLILGGNISRAYGLFGPALEKGLAGSGLNIEIKISELMEQAAMIGAASLFA